MPPEQFHSHDSSTCYCRGPLMWPTTNNRDICSLQKSRSLHNAFQSLNLLLFPTLCGLVDSNRKSKVQIIVSRTSTTLSCTMHMYTHKQELSKSTALACEPLHDMAGTLRSALSRYLKCGRQWPRLFTQRIRNENFTWECRRVHGRRLRTDGVRGAPHASWSSGRLR